MRKILVGLTTAALVASLAIPALAKKGGGMSNSDDIIVTNNNCAFVNNSVTVTADTGDNDANGGIGSSGGAGGNADYNANMGGAQTNSGGNGGAGGAGGNGGSIVTGDAESYVYLGNQVNDTKTVVDACACDDESESCGMCGWWYQSDDDDYKGDIKVTNNNHAMIMNSVSAVADTGDNVADHNWNKDCHHQPGGCYGFYWPSNSNQTNDAGNGGKGGEGGSGGSIKTGDAWAGAEVVNVVNSVVTRIYR
jgi:hypothetical protein